MDSAVRMGAGNSSSMFPKPMYLDDVRFQQHHVMNRPPTPQDLLELSARIYRASRKLYSEADSQGMRVYHDELIMGDVRMVMLVPSWFPKAHVAFDWGRVQGDAISVVLVLRGTMQDLIGNTKANLQLIFNKLVDDEHLPDVAADATKVIQAWLTELLWRHPNLDPGRATHSSSRRSGQQQQHGKQLHLDVHVTGHSLGGLLSEVATVESYGFAAAHGMTWHCTSFESPGLPELYHRAALRMAPRAHWDDIMVGYLAAPNVINMLYEHLGRVIHVVVPWEQTWSHVAKCVSADVARVTAWAILGGMVLAGMKQVTGAGSAAAAASSTAAGAVRRQEEEGGAAGAPMLPGSLGLGPGGSVAAIGRPAAAAVQIGGLSMQQCDARMPQVSLGVPAAGVTSAGVSLGVPSVGTVAAVPTVFTVAETTGSGRTLASIGGSSLNAAAVAAAAGAANAAGPSAASLPARVSGAVVGAVAAAGEAAASVGSTHILQYVVRRSGLGVLVNAVGGWLMGRGGITGLMECLAGVLGVEVEELIAQHALCPMRQCFDPHTGQLKARYRREMACWPHLGRRRKVLLTAAQQVAKWSMPSFICQDNVGLVNIMSRTAMVETRCARLKGYVVKEGLNDDAFLAAEAAAAGVGPVGTAAAVDAQPLLEQLLDAEQHLLEQQMLEHQQQQWHMSPPRLAAGAQRTHISIQHSAGGAAPGAGPLLPQRGQMHRKMLRPHHQHQQAFMVDSAEQQRDQQWQQYDDVEQGLLLQTTSGSAAGAGSSTAAAAAAAVAGLQGLIAEAAAMDLDDNAELQCEGLQLPGVLLSPAAVTSDAPELHIDGSDWLVVGGSGAAAAAAAATVGQTLMDLEHVTDLEEGAGRAGSRRMRLAFNGC